MDKPLYFYQNFILSQVFSCGFVKFYRTSFFGTSVKCNFSTVFSFVSTTNVNERKRRDISLLFAGFNLTEKKPFHNPQFYQNLTALKTLF